MSSGNDAYLIVDDTNPGLIYSNNDWFDNVVADAFNQTLSSTTTNGATVQLQFEGVYARLSQPSVSAIHT